MSGTLAACGPGYSLPEMRESEAIQTRDVPAGACGTDTWTNYARDFMAPKCGNCHPTLNDPDVSNYDDVLANAAKIKARVGNDTMPPGAPLGADEKTRFLKWVACKALK